MKFKHIEHVESESLNYESNAKDGVSIQEFSDALFDEKQNTSSMKPALQSMESEQEQNTNNSSNNHHFVNATHTNYDEDNSESNNIQTSQSDLRKTETEVDSLHNTITRSEKIVGTNLGTTHLSSVEAHNTKQHPFGKKKIIGKGSVSVNPTKICVMGVGGAGVNAANMMVRQNIQGVEIIAANTDAQTLNSSLVDVILPIGNSISGGLGVGGNPLKGAEAAREARKDIHDLVKDYDMLFLAAGLGGGTGTGATPYIAEIAKELGVLTVGVITLPFAFEGPKKSFIAQEGLKDLETELDALIVIPNDNISHNDYSSTEFGVLDGFEIVDNVLANTVRSITEIITSQSLINIDFADIKNCLSSAGRIAVGFGYADAKEGKNNNAHSAVEAAFKNTVISQENIEIMQNANHIIANTVAGNEVSFNEYTAISDMIASRVNSSGRDYLFKHGYRVDNNWGKKVQITIIASNKDNLDNRSQYTNQNSNISTTTKMSRSKLTHTHENFQDSIYMQPKEHNSSYSDMNVDGYREPVKIESDYVKNNMFEQLLDNKNFELEELDVLENELNNERYNTPALNRLLGLKDPVKSEAKQNFEKLNSE